VASNNAAQVNCHARLRNVVLELLVADARG